MQEALTVYRNERKYELSHVDSLRLQEEMQILLEPDIFSKEGSYCVRSLYFDTLNNKDYKEKEDGVQYRQKIRLRIYDTKDERTKFELKAKNGNYQHKTSLLVSREDAKLLQEGDYGILLDYDSETALRLYSELTLGCYRPVALIEYDRRAFIYPENNTRITFDTKIRCSEMDLDIFNEQVAWIPVGVENAILEVKYDDRLYKPISMILQKYHLNNISYSKYGNGRPIMEAYI
ncbi:MAG: polyphosphate polymerase domain-containing protein [Lachnospiraceae bacterium]|nr:polyphosphate polymerase domain-containing protein [Lachnospiraceae bacterium]